MLDGGRARRDPSKSSEIELIKGILPSMGRMSDDLGDVGRCHNAERTRTDVLVRSVTVELPGIEPGSFVMSVGLLRVQFATPLLGSLGHANKPR